MMEMRQIYFRSKIRARCTMRTPPHTPIAVGMLFSGLDIISGKQAEASLFRIASSSSPCQMAAINASSRDLISSPHNL
jgi:hypothetical protein